MRSRRLPNWFSGARKRTKKVWQRCTSVGGDHSWLSLHSGTSPVLSLFWNAFYPITPTCQSNILENNSNDIAASVLIDRSLSGSMLPGTLLPVFHCLLIITADGGPRPLSCPRFGAFCTYFAPQMWALHDWSASLALFCAREKSH